MLRAKIRALKWLFLAGVMLVGATVQARAAYTWNFPSVTALEAQRGACGQTFTSAYVQGVGIYQWNSTSMATHEEAV